MNSPVDLILASPLGTRMTVRRKIEGGFSDALGYLRLVSDSECVMETRRGLVTIPLSEVAAAKHVPPPPVPRASRHTAAD